MNNPIDQTGNFNRTDRYKHVQTSDIVNKFLSMGYKVTATSQVKTRKVEKQGFQKHLLRFSNENNTLVNVNDSRPEIVLINSHDGSTGYEMMMGIFRLVCANGLIVGNTFGGVKFRHSGDDVMGRVEKAVEEIQREVPRIASAIETFKSVQLTESKAMEYAEQAVKLLVPNSAFNVNLNSALVPRREADLNSDLWTIYNRVQETFLRGGLTFQTRNYNLETREMNIRNATSRTIKNISRQVEVNRKLWDLTEEFSKVA